MERAPTGPLFRSARLAFRAWEERDVEGMAAINADPEVMRFFPGPLTPELTHAFLERMHRHFEEHGFCYYAVDRSSDGAFIGFIGLARQDYPSDHTPCVDIGWRLDKRFWGQGLATEGAKRCLEHAFAHLGLKEVLAHAPAINRPSIRVMQKIGMRPRGTFIHPRLAEDARLRECVSYGISSGSRRT